MGVNLGGADAGMTEHLLYCQEIGTAFQQMGREAMAERVRTDGFVDAVAFSQFLDQEKHGLAGQSGTTTV